LINFNLFPKDGHIFPFPLISVKNSTSHTFPDKFTDSITTSVLEYLLSFHTIRIQSLSPFSSIILRCICFHNVDVSTKGSVDIKIQNLTSSEVTAFVRCSRASDGLYNTKFIKPTCLCGRAGKVYDMLGTITGPIASKTGGLAQYRVDIYEHAGNDSAIDCIVMSLYQLLRFF
jgi:hypothetical protein